MGWERHGVSNPVGFGWTNTLMFYLKEPRTALTLTPWMTFCWQWAESNLHTVCTCGL